uniref:Uncharacterized protein n=1 Tax=Percolomonas cosmopolitus TaxID=63605 RepID=A0A7S1PG37_9EUKA|eukprot:CAMPEP_0117446614 /NCGR_PEP_ID=MMETSP0759-20121206/6440_1 /TAXON_ID=63605 /ORGANISM="Percolomonas cosmopolitus, Strain WS" /LENGTH=337 /DNA_ID=CAMNT_0005238903 /DNA_START=40 /DNA_END=1053 /DNA_ORIENTATION=+
MGNETSKPNNQSLGDSSLHTDAAKRRKPQNEAQISSPALKKDSIIASSHNDSQQQHAYTTFSVSKQPKASSLLSNQSIQNTKQKLFAKFGTLAGAVQGAATNSSSDDVSDIYYVNSEQDVRQFKESQISELNRIKKEIEGMPAIPLLIPEPNADASASNFALNKMIKKTIKNVLNVSEGGSSAPHIEEMSPKVLADIFADFQTKGLQGYKALLVRQHHVVQRAMKESIHIKPVSNAKMKQTNIWFRDFSVLRRDLRKANQDMYRTMQMISDLGHMLPANVRDNVDTPLFATFNDSTMPEIIREANERSAMAARRRRTTTHELSAQGSSTEKPEVEVK